MFSHSDYWDRIGTAPEIKFIFFFFSSMGLEDFSSGNKNCVHQEPMDLHGAKKQFFSIQRTKTKCATGQHCNYHQDVPFLLH